MQQETLSPDRRKRTDAHDHSCPSTPLDQRRRISFSYSAPTNKVRNCDENGNTFVMSSSGGRKKKTSNHSCFPETSLFEDEESVLVASPFAYVTPPMPPREQVSNTKTTKAMAKIVEEEGTPDSVIRKLAFGAGNYTLESPNEERRAPDTVNRASRVKSLTDDTDDDGFRFPMLSPESREAMVADGDQDSSSDGVSRLSLSMVDLNPPSSPQPLRPNAGSRAEIFDSCTVPDLLVNCGICGKQFISDKFLKDHSEFCKLEGRSRLGNSDASTLAQTTDTALVSVASSVHIQSGENIAMKPAEGASHANLFTDSPALPMYMQRALSANTLPSVAPPPMAASPSILASPTEETEEFLEEEISTFLECLRADHCEKWNSRRAKIGRVKSEHLLCVSSEDEFESSTALQSIGGSNTGLVLAPVAPPMVPMSSNIYSPIPHQRSSFDNEISMTTSFLSAPGPMGSPCSPIVASKLPAVTESLEELGRTSPTFGRLSMRSSVAPSVSDSAMTFAGNLSVRASQRVACKCCGRKFATPSRLDRHEAVCEQVFGLKTERYSEPVEISKTEHSEIEVQSTTCKYCGRNFSHVEKLRRHEHVCLSVFKGRRRSKSPIASSSLSTSAVSHESSVMRSKSPTNISNESGASSIRSKSPRSVINISKSPSTAVRRPRVTSVESVSIDSVKPRNLKVQQFGCLVVGGGPQATVAVGVQTVGLHQDPVKREFVRSMSSSHSSESSLMSRSSLEFQYQQLRDQIKTCSEKLKLRRSIIYRDA